MFNSNLNRVESISGFSDIDSNELNFNCKHLIIDSSYAPDQFFTEFNSQISRCILVTDKSIFNKQDDPKKNENDQVKFCVCIFF